MKLLLILCSVLGLSYGFLERKPDVLKTCRFDDPEFIKCSTESISGMVKALAEGVKLFNDPIKIDPLLIPIERILSPSGPVNIDASLKNINITGMHDAVVQESRVSPTDYGFTTTLFVPKIRFEADIDVEGRILLVPVNGKGHCWFEPKHLDVVLKTKNKLVERDNHVFYNVTDIEVEYKLKELTFYIDNLILEGFTNRFLNSNWQRIERVINPVIRTTIQRISLKLFKRVFDNIPADYFIEDIPRTMQITNTQDFAPEINVENSNDNYNNNNNNNYSNNNNNNNNSNDYNNNSDNDYNNNNSGNNGDDYYQNNGNNDYNQDY